MSQQSFLIALFPYSDIQELKLSNSVQKINTYIWLIKEHSKILCTVILNMVLYRGYNDCVALHYIYCTSINIITWVTVMLFNKAHNLLTENYHHAMDGSNAYNDTHMYKYYRIRPKILDNK